MSQKSFVCTQLRGFKYLYLTLLVQFNIKSLVCRQLLGFKFSKWLNRSIWPINGTLTDTTTPSLSKPGCTGNEGALHIPQSSRTGASLSDCPIGWGCRIHRLLLCRGVKPLPMSVLDMTLNLMVRFQWCWSFGECGALVHCHCSQVHSGPEW